MISRKALLHTAAVYVLAVVAALLMLTPAWAGEYFERDGAALRGHDPVAYFSENKPVKGSTMWSADIPGFIVKADGHWPTASSQNKVID